MATRLTPIASEFQVNQGVTNNPQTDHDLTPVPDGRLAVVYEHEFNASGVKRIPRVRNGTDLGTLP